MNILERIKLIRPQLNAELSANQDIRHAGDILSGINPEGSWLTGRSQFDPRSQLSPIQAQGSWAFTSPKSPGTFTNDIVAKARKREAERAREDFVGQGAYGTIYSDEPGLVRKEMISTEALEELNAQAIGAELGLAPRVVAYESAVHGDPEVKAIVMQDLRDNYEPAFDPGIHPELIDVLGAADMNTSAKNRRFAMDHQKQMGALALKGLEVMDRHTGNVMRHKMTGRPIQLDWGITRELSNLSDKVEALINATVEGFKASGQYDIAEIINDTVYDYVVGGQIKEAWDFTKEAFASLQKIKNPVAFPANQI